MNQKKMKKNAKLKALEKIHFSKMMKKDKWKIRKETGCHFRLINKTANKLFIYSPWLEIYIGGNGIDLILKIMWISNCLYY